MSRPKFPRARALTGYCSILVRLVDRKYHLFDILMMETNPIPVKWSLFEMGLDEPHIRLPVAGLYKEYREQFRRCFHGLGLIPC